MTDRRRWSRSARTPGHDVHRQDLNWHLTIAHQACSIATGFCLCYVKVDLEKGCNLKGSVDTDEASYLNSRALVSESLVGWVQLMSSSCSFQNAVNSESGSAVPVPWPGTQWLLSHCVIFSLHSKCAGADFNKNLWHIIILKR